ncbi:Protein FAR1-RELATED SEQUENCE [Abeliophyllum distichum]|uniref:Protein FAR1-RELATED SEQUENCE n=1 Tax=Abeliophyllum distichum TaxID=126358 RepID=A0ABD1Q162_9LAMI
MSSSQRSESGLFFFKRYVNRKNSLMDFVTRFNMALRHQRHEKLVANHIDINEQPILTSKFQMEHKMVQVYTKKIFLLFQTEIDQSHYYVCSKKSASDDAKVYMVQRVEHDKYILRRWTKNAKVIAVEYPSASISDGGSCNSSVLSRHGMLAHKSSLLVDDAALTDARTSFLMKEFETLHLRIKGCGKRLKSSKEKSLAKNSRQCSICGQNGHDKRTCPTSTMETYQPDMNDQLTHDEGRSEATFMSYTSSQCDMDNWFL